MRRLAELMLGHVHARHAAAGAHEVRGHERVRARAAAQVDDMVAGRQLGQIDHVPDPGKRRQRLRRHRVQPSRRIAQPLGQAAAHLEVKVAGRIAGDLAVHRANLATNLLQVHNGDSVATVITSAKLRPTGARATAVLPYFAAAPTARALAARRPPR